MCYFYNHKNAEVSLFKREELFLKTVFYGLRFGEMKLQLRERDGCVFRLLQSERQLESVLRRCWWTTNQFPL